MARNEELERRCLNWARWKESGGTAAGRSGGLGYASLYLPAVTAGRPSGYEAKVPTLDIEAEQTYRGVQALPSHLRRTVEVYYLGDGSMEARCNALQISRPTLYVRIDKAHEALAAWLRDADARLKHQREASELVQASARPRGDATKPLSISARARLAKRARQSSKD